MTAIRNRKYMLIGKRVLLESFAIMFILGMAVGYVATMQTNVQLPLRQLPEHLTASANIVAVRSDGAGVIGSVDAEIFAGKGRVLIDTNPFVEPDTQLSAETAVAVASSFAKASMADRDIIVSFNINGTLIGGPSAGAAMTAAAIAAMESKQVRDDVAITGTIEGNGRIGSVGGVIEKSQAAGEKGIKLFLVPKGQLKGTYYEREAVEERRGSFIIRRVNYVPKVFDLNNFTIEQYGMEIREIASINEAVGFMLK